MRGKVLTHKPTPGRWDKAFGIMVMRTTHKFSAQVRKIIFNLVKIEHNIVKVMMLLPIKINLE